ncbi:MAG: Histidine triad (HIT) protein [archaeon GW2011_AR20]|nr:MAG: Histidine triad (HIT) protein [archaeon GW2011_AR20]MBS3160658.1 HIT family protein [Candidatus Woesearchaeota archaeon]
MEDCVFCKIIKNKIPAIKVYEDDEVLAILDVRPATKHGGHTLVMPKEHFELITDLPDDLLKKLSLVIKKISKALLKFGNGLNILQNNKKYAGQVIPHVHFHLIPRFENDNVKVEKWVVNEYREGEIEKTASKIKSLLK